jgi:signal transduction histidine kinase
MINSMNTGADLQRADDTWNNISVMARNAWDSLTQPALTIVHPQEQRRSRLLAGILLVVLAVGALILLVRALQVPASIDDADYMASAAALSAIAGLYALARRGHTDFAAAALITLMLVLFVVVAFAPNSLDTLLYFATLPILLTALFFSIRQVVGVAALAVVVPLLLSQVSGEMTLMNVMDAAQFILLSTAVVVVYMNHTRALEQIRRRELQAAYDQVRASEQVLEQRVQERTRELQIATEQAERAREQAEQANRIKSQFLASMSHELRTPLNAILTFTELILRGTFGPVNAEQIDYLQKSLQSGRHLLSLINDVLDITKIQAGMMKLFIENDFEVEKELGIVAASAEKLLRDKPVQLVMDVDGSLPTLRCDKRRIRQVLLNLLSNAIKFTDEGTITLSAKKREDDVLFAVIDSGPGIAEDQHAIIFEPFVQTEAGIRHAGGTGLGLPISKQLIEAHRGRLWVESTLGQGAAFFATIPLQSSLELGEKEI